MPNIHPIVIHFPIVLLIAAFVCEGFGWLFKNTQLKHIARWALFLGTIALAVAALTGWLGHKTVTHSDMSYPMIEQHQRLGFITLGIFGVLSAVKLFSNTELQSRQWFSGFILAIYFLGIGILAWGSHLGGLLVYEMGVGVQAVDHTRMVKTPNLDKQIKALFKLNGLEEQQ